MRLRVVTVNVWHDEGDPGRTEVINGELRRLDPDLVALQEVLHTPENDQLARIIDGTGLHGTHQAQVATTTPPNAERHGGNAVATRWPHRVVEALDLRGEGAPTCRGRRSPSRCRCRTRARCCSSGRGMNPGSGQG